MEVNAAILRRKHNLMKGILPVLAAPTPPTIMPPLWAGLHFYNALDDYVGEVNRLISTLGLARRAEEISDLAVSSGAWPEPPTPWADTGAIAAVGKAIAAAGAAESPASEPPSLEVAAPPDVRDRHR
jgi:hypothetical protein